jgi:hypothetical protein
MTVQLMQFVLDNFCQNYIYGKLLSPDLAPNRGQVARRRHRPGMHQLVPKLV